MLGKGYWLPQEEKKKNTSHWQIPFHARSRATLRISDLFPGINKFIFIKSNVLKLDIAQKVYSVNKGLFLGMLFSPWFAYMGRYRLAIYRALVNYAEIFICWLLILMQQSTRTITAAYLACTIGKRFLMPNGMLWYCVMAPECLARLHYKLAVVMTNRQSHRAKYLMAWSYSLSALIIW